MNTVAAWEQRIGQGIDQITTLDQLEAFEDRNKPGFSSMGDKHRDAVLRVSQKIAAKREGFLRDGG